MSSVMGVHVGLLWAEAGPVCERVRTCLVRTDKGCTGQVRASSAWEEKRAEANIAQSIVQFPLMESSALHVWRLKRRSPRRQCDL